LSAKHRIGKATPSTGSLFSVTSLALTSGATMPADTISLAPSSIDMSSGTISDLCTYIRKPVVGLGVQGMNTAISGSPS